MRTPMRTEGNAFWVLGFLLESVAVIQYGEPNPGRAVVTVVYTLASSD